MKTGDIVRRKLSTGVLVGSFKVIDNVVDHGSECGMYAHDIPNNILGSMYYRKDEVQQLRHVMLPIPHTELKSVIEDRLSRVQHIATIKWEAALKEQKLQPYEVVTLKSSSGHIIVTEPVFRRITYKTKVYVQIEFVRILEEVGI